MRTISASLLAVMIVGSSVGTSSSPQVGRAPGRVVTVDEYERWKTELSNWGRWGKNDEIGALNLITPAKRKQAAALVKEGVSVSLAADTDTIRAVDNPTRTSSRCSPLEPTVLRSRTTALPIRTSIHSRT